MAAAPETPEERHNRYRNGGRCKIFCRPNQRIVARTHLRADGTPKVRWPNPTSARFVAELNNWRREHGRPWKRHVEAYYCGFCKGWHVGAPMLPQWFHSMPERAPELMAELGVRAVAIMWSQNTERIRLEAGDTPERRAARLRHRPQLVA